MLRVLPGLYASRPADLAALVQQHERYVSFYLLRAALRDDEIEVTIAGQFPIPARNRPFPLFRSPGPPHRVTGKIRSWWLWDEQRKWKVAQLTQEQWDLPLDGIPSHPLFIEQIVSGWQPRDDPLPWHVLYFPTELAAQVAAHRLRQHVQADIDVDVQQAPPDTLVRR